MPYDIYGNPLRPGHCEAHPNVPELYPCSKCYAEYEEYCRERDQEPPDDTDEP